jgi:hypothetical protein
VQCSAVLVLVLVLVILLVLVLVLVIVLPLLTTKRAASRATNRWPAYKPPRALTWMVDG